MKDLSSEIEKLNKSNNEKVDLIKALDEKVTSLQNLAQEMVSAICKRMNENDQLHSTNEKILDQQIGDIDYKLVKAIKKLEEEIEEPRKKAKDTTENIQFKCKECSLTFMTKSTLKKHILVNHPKKVKCNVCEETFDQIWKH